MKLTHEWLTKQIKDYTLMLSRLDKENDDILHTIWTVTVYTLKATLKVLEAEMRYTQ